MAWVMFFVAAVCIALAFQAQSIGLAAIALLAALGLMLAGAFKLASARINARSRNAASMLGPEELAVIRRQAAAQAAAATRAEQDNDSVAPGGDGEGR